MSKLVTREEWGAEAPRSSMSARKPVTRQVVHHSAGIQLPVNATLKQECEYVRAIQQGHFARGFSDIAYHRLVAPSGRVYEGRDPKYQGAGVYGQNEDTIHVCALGSYHIPSNKPSKRMLTGIAKALRDLPGTRRKLVGHCDIGPSECPGDNLYVKLGEIRKLRKGN